MDDPMLADPASLWQDYLPTRLIELPDLARLARVGRVLVKAESERPLGNFKALGGVLAGLRALAKAAGVATLAELAAPERSSRRPLPCLICASDGNHGLAVAAAAARVGARALIHLPVGVDPDRAARIEALGGEIVRVRGTYDDAVAAASTAAARGDGVLVPDTSSDPHDPVVADVMDGYALLARELVSQFQESAGADDRPSHLFVQAGVGGLAAAMADGLRELMRAPGRLLIVEPESAACVASALAAGRPVRIPGELRTSAEMLSCGLASAPALAVLQRSGACPVLVREDQLQAAPGVLRTAGGPETTASGAAGLAGLLHVAADPRLCDELRLDQDSTVLLIATEGPLRESAAARQLATPAVPPF